MTNAFSISSSIVPVLALLLPGCATPKGTVATSEEPPRREGSLTAEEIESVIRANLGSIKECYESALRIDKNLQGKVTVKFTISLEGPVASAEIDPEKTALDSASVKTCIRIVVLSWKFPKPRGNGVVHVRYPFVLQPR